MRLLIAHKLFLALLTATAVVVVVALLLTRWSFNHGFLDYVNAVEGERIARVAESLAAIYAETNSWDALVQNPQRWYRVLSANTGRPPRGDGRLMPPSGAGFDGPGNQQGPGFEGPRGLHGPEFFHRRGPPPIGPMVMPQPVELLDANNKVLFGRPEHRPGSLQIPVNSAGKVVGYLRYLPVSALTDLKNAAEQEFIAQQRTELLITAAIALIVAALLALIFGRRLVAPIRALVAGTEALSIGRLAHPVAVSSRDELGQLAESFNSMVAALAQARGTQQQWITDIAHELRTPLTILAGELQALEDGVREWNTASQASLHAEINRLHALIDDLHEVSLSDAGGMGYQRSDIELGSIVARAIDSHRSRIAASGLRIETQLPDSDIALHGDARRLEQLVSNLLENSCRYTDAGGLIRVTCTVGNTVVLRIEDTAPGVPDDALPRLFDRLFRVEQSRSRGHGGSGLGLAICKGIVEAHGGTISAGPSALGGLCITVELPRVQP